MLFQEYLTREISEIFPCGAFLSCVADVMFIEAPLFQERFPTPRENFSLHAC